MPVFLQVVFAFSTSIIAAIGVYVAFQQWKLGAYKLKHDLFDRRWAVYAATNDAIVTTLNGEPEDRHERFQKFLIKAKDAAFLFPGEVTEYLSEIEQTLSELRSLEREIKIVGIGTTRRHEIETLLIQKNEWLSRQVPLLVPKFKAYLDLTAS